MDINAPTVNIIHDLVCLSLTMCNDKVLVDPFNEHVLKAALDDLVEEIRRQHFMNVGPWKVMSERLF